MVPAPLPRMLIICVSLCVFAPTAIGGEPGEERTALAFFEKKVRPVLAERCYKCHSIRSKKQRGGLRLDTRSDLLQGGDSGVAVRPGEPEKSLLIQAMRYRNKSLQMPPKSKLPEREIAILTEWVQRGALMPDDAPGLSGVDLTEGRKFWSFQPPKEVKPPTTRDRMWARRPIDAFILAELDKHRLAPSPTASRRVLIRRAYFDLIGLPPMPEEVDTFVNDPAPDAYARLVERLLASPHYGERWGRFWLDLARYCDVAEPWSESKGRPYLYRDWVVRALNEDMPYDEFVQRQLAADLMPEAAPANLAALGFLGLSPTYWKELKLDKDVIKTVVAEEWEERIEAVSRTFLGLTVACARCHDHKFDPISTQDYYALAGIFASIRQTDRPLLPDERAASVRRARERVKALQDQINKMKSKKPAASDASKQVDALKAEIGQIERTTPDYGAPLAPVVEEASLFVLADGPHRTKLEWRPGAAQDVAMQIRGNPAKPGPVVPRRFLAVLSADAPKPFEQGSGRLGLARALVTEGAPLSARVIVNRVWKHHFGSGLVETPSNFGTQGARPSHPQLLDDLTARFVRNGWSLKWLHREIMLSATYRQSSGHDEIKHAVDPDNRLLGRMNRRRLEVEAWRDAMLSVSETLDRRQGGPAQDLADVKNLRRTIYGRVKRRELNDLLRLNDFPDPTSHSPSRVPTTTPLQQLFVLNSPFLQRQAAALVERLKKEAPSSMEERVRRAYLLLYGRPATEPQVKLAVAFLTAENPASAVSDATWQQYMQVLLGSNEFLFVD
ncbi:MAG TPA: PSD1 and planctomycete cytochrome C domain-containing protein [Gemmataceae bacterium]